MSFLNFAKLVCKNFGQLKNLALDQTRGYKAEVFYHSRGIFSNDESQRGRHYQAKVLKRIRTHGLETRLQTRGGKQMLWRKIVKGPAAWTQFAPAP
ncbi:hypothetical protein BpHYR1_032886 [Brachionus plicatilis]|uniref:Uncharacterized protein n=1 Tax=Brachionus plicatilis TaxID=10195 RepID=A0A3M7PZ01_BRAPC|nr:hypothetical protein BpHYR1_032886 [Brachionus plicatilis]